MNTLLLYAEINLFCIAVILTLAATSYVHPQTGNRGKLFFLLSALSAAAAGFFDCFWSMGLMGAFSFSAGIMTALNALYFLSFGVSAYFWFLFSEATIESRIFESKRKLFCAAIPLLLLAVLLILSLFTDLLFRYDATAGTFSCHTFYYVQYILCSIYILLATVRNIVAVFRKANYARRREFISVAGFVVPPIVCGILKIFLPDAPLITPGIVFSFLLIYVRSLNELNAQDAVTGLGNRRDLLKKWDAQSAALGHNERLYLLFLDIDSFKKINDLYGHAEGDRALLLVGAGLRRVSRETGGFCARYGGDEFVFLQTLDQNENIGRVVDRITETVRSECENAALTYPIRISIGYSEYQKGSGLGIWELIEAADADMYRHKTHRK